jgi:hypothetical protein
MSNLQDNQIVDQDIRTRLERLEARSHDARFWRGATLTLLALLLSAPFVVAALGPVPHLFSNGDVISASEMNENFAHLQDAISSVEAKVPSGSCASNQIARFDGASWTCSDEAAPSSGDANIVVNGSAISLNSTIDVSTVAATTLDLNPSLQWNNSASNSAVEMTVFTHTATCDAGQRGRVRIIRQEDIGNSMDLGDSLCFCQEYIDRTPEPDAAPVYHWVCIYPQSDGN